MVRRWIAVSILVFVLYLAPLAYPISSFTGSGVTYVYTSRTIYSSPGTEPLVLDAEDLMMNVFPNTSRQTTRLVVGDPFKGWVSDADSNPCLVFTSNTIPASGNLTLSLSLQIIERAAAPPRIGFEASGNLSDIPSSLGRYLESGGSTWQGDDPRIRALAQNILTGVGNTTNVLRVVVATTDWLGWNVAPASHDLVYSPVETYEAREGDCDDQALLLITLLRSLGIPSYLQVGAIWTERSESSSRWNDHVTNILINIVFHAWAMVYVPPWGWLPFDLTLGWRPDDSLAVVKDAPVWGSNILVILNAVTMDWVGDGKKFEEWVSSKNVRILTEDRLQRVLSLVEIFGGVYPWLLGTTFLSVALYIMHDRLRCRFGASH